MASSEREGEGSDLAMERKVENVQALVRILQDTNGSLAPHLRYALLEASWDIQRLAMSPTDVLEQYQIHSCLQWLLRFDILAHVPSSPNQNVPYATVADSAQVPLDRLKSVARMAMTKGILSEPKPNHLAHSRISAELASQEGLRDWMTFMMNYSVPVAAQFAASTQKWGDTSRKDQTAFNLAFDTQSPFFDYIGQEEKSAALFARYMQSLGQSEGLSIKHILRGYDWAKLGEGHVVDVGGSTGEVAILLAQHYTSLRFTVQDLPSTISGAQTHLDALPSTVKSRISFQAHDFFDPQPDSISDTVDIFFLRRILHDWSLRETQQILGNLAGALKRGARIVIMDTILPPPGESGMSALREAGLRVKDLTMAQGFNSGEREMEEWVELIEGVRPPLKLLGYKQPERSMMAMLVLEGNGGSVA